MEMLLWLWFGLQQIRLTSCDNMVLIFAQQEATHFKLTESVRIYQELDKMEIPLAVFLKCGI